jgi:hypothetical protein
MLPGASPTFGEKAAFGINPSGRGGYHLDQVALGKGFFRLGYGDIGPITGGSVFCKDNQPLVTANGLTTIGQGIKLDLQDGSFFMSSRGFLSRFLCRVLRNRPISLCLYHLIDEKLVEGFRWLL